MRLHERRRHSRFHRSFSDKYHYGMSKREEEEAQEEEIQKRIKQETIREKLGSDYRVIKSVQRNHRNINIMGNIAKFAPLAILGGLAYFLLDMYVF